MSIVKIPSLLLLAFSFSLLATNSHSQVHFDFYQFVVWYAPGMCIGLDAPQTCAQDLPESWTIHGLWPSINSTTNMEISCEQHTLQLGITFRESKIHVKDLVVMEQVWPNLLDKSNEILWKHEYEKHGTCRLPDPTYPDWDDALRAYFRASVNIFRDPHTSVPDALAYNNIVPGSQTSEATIRDAIKQKITEGKEPRIVCRSTKGGTVVLAQIAFCFEKNLREIIYRDCPEETNCYKIFANHNLQPEKQIIEYVKPYVSTVGSTVDMQKRG